MEEEKREQRRNEAIAKEVQEWISTAEMMETYPPVWRKARRLDYLFSRRIEIEEYLLDFYKFYEAEIIADRLPFWRLLAYRCREIRKLEKELKRIDWQIHCSHNDDTGGGVTNEMIHRAKEFPFADLLHTKKTLINCPFHEDRSPSMIIRGDYAWCFSCQRGWDTIEFVRWRDGLGFVEAVKKLVGRSTTTS